jgi:peptidoglycan DL-endopeptidase CwlO
MNVNSFSNAVSNPYIQSLISNTISNATNGSSSVSQSSLTQTQDANQLSPFAQILSTLQQLQQSNPTEYQQVTSQIATNLQSAAKTATGDGNTSQANELNQLATDFQNASQNNTLPNVQDLAQALSGHGHHHGGHHVSSSSDSSSTSAATSSTGSSASTTSSSGSSGSDPLAQLLSAFFGNQTSVSQNTSLDPMTIINNTLSGAGLS